MRPQTGAARSRSPRTRLGGVPNGVRNAVAHLRPQGLCLTWGGPACGLGALTRAGTWRSRGWGTTNFVPFQNRRLRRRACGNLELRCLFPCPPSSCPLLLVSWDTIRQGRDGEAGARWCSGMTESNPGGRCRTQLHRGAGFHGGGGEDWARAASGPGGLVRSASWPPGLGIAPWPESGRALQGVVAGGLRLSSPEENLRGAGGGVSGESRSGFCC